MKKTQFTFSIITSSLSAVYPDALVHPSATYDSLEEAAMALVTTRLKIVGAEQYPFQDSMGVAKLIWSELANVCVDDDGVTESPFLCFPAGTDREEIWAWMEEYFDVCVGLDLMSA